MSTFPTPPEPCILAGVPDELYHSHASVSKSTLKYLVDGTPRECKDYIDNGLERTAALERGNAVELAILDPGGFRERVVVKPRFTGTGAVKRRSEWEAEHANHVQVSQADYDRAIAAGDMARKKRGPSAAFRAGTAQLSLLWQDAETDLWCRARPDFALLTSAPDKRMFVDVKVVSGRGGSPLADRGIQEHLTTYGAAIQAAMFRAGFTAVTGEPAPACYLLCVAATGPLDMRLVYIGQEWLEYGEAAFRHALRLYAACAATGDWPGYVERGIDPVAMPDWLRAKTERMMNENDSRGAA